MITKPSVLLPIAPGTNRNAELAIAFEAAGAATEQVPLQAIRSGAVKLADHQLLALPGGFSYGDALGAGRLLGLDLAGWFADQLNEAVEREMPIIGICNGFQALVKAGLLPGDQRASLAENSNGRFECRWVTLSPRSSRSVWTAELTEDLRCPVAHGEGRFAGSDSEGLVAADRVAFTYVRGDGSQADGTYPDNPNGSDLDIAGVTDPSGLILGLMPHPEDHVFRRQDPLRARTKPGQPSGSCLDLFKAGVKAARG